MAKRAGIDRLAVVLGCLVLFGSFATFYVARSSVQQWHEAFDESEFSRWLLQASLKTGMGPAIAVWLAVRGLARPGAVQIAANIGGLVCGLCSLLFVHTLASSTHGGDEVSRALLGGVILFAYGGWGWVIGWSMIRLLLAIASWVLDGFRQERT